MVRDRDLWQELGYQLVYLIEIGKLIQSFVCVLRETKTRDMVLASVFTDD